MGWGGVVGNRVSSGKNFEASGIRPVGGQLPEQADGWPSITPSLPQLLDIRLKDLHSTLTLKLIPADMRLCVCLRSAPQNQSPNLPPPAGAGTPDSQHMSEGLIAVYLRLSSN